MFDPRKIDSRGAVGLSSNRNAIRALAVVLGLAVALAATALVASTSSGAGHTSAAGVTPTSYPGNFVSSGDDDQVCYDMSAQGLIGEQTGELHGFKVDPPVDFDNGDVSVDISADGKSLSWESAPGVTVLAVIVKGGPNFNVYDYTSPPTLVSSDSGLHSPLHKGKVPQISHYNVCYSIEPPAEGDEGCTPGYWRNHADRWLGVTPGDDFDATFAVDAFDPNQTLGQAVQLGGGGVNALARHAVAALLNSYGGVPNGDGEVVDYPFTTAEVLAMVKAAIDSGDAAEIEATKNTLDEANNLGCPLSGTPALPV